MAEQDNMNMENMPVFRLEKIYLKDFSFEAPNSPEVFFLEDQEPKVEMNMKLTNSKIDEKHFEVCMEVSATITDTKSGKALMIIEVEHAGGFLLENIPEEHLQQVLHVECPMTLFPYTRQLISQASVDGGFMPFLMEPINFLQLYQAKLQRDQQGEAQDS
jgi:preprotein translocase subunit SecB